MYVLILPMLAGLWFVTLTSVAQAGDFEGIIHIQMSHAGGPAAQMNWSIKGDKARIERPREDGRS